MSTNPAPTGNYVSTSRCMIALFSLVVLSGVLPHQEQSLSQSRQDAPYTVSISVDTVVLHATVSDRKGTPVSELVKKDFQVYEDGIPQQIEYFSHEDIPVTVGLVIDNSGTMGSKRREVIVSALAFARSSNPEDQMFVVYFNEKVWFGLPDDLPFTDKMDQLELALARINANGMTALYDAVTAALHHLEQGNRDKKVLIVISDGGTMPANINWPRSCPWLVGPMQLSIPSASLMRTIPTGMFVRSSSLQTPPVANLLAGLDRRGHLHLQTNRS